MNILLIFIATLALGVRFSIPKNMLLVSSAVAASCYFLVGQFQSLGATSAEAAFLGAFSVAMSAEFLARVYKVPSPVISIPGIIPLVPGNMAYRSVTHFVSDEELQGLAVAAEVMTSAAGIASGLLLASALARKALKPVFAITKASDV